MKTKVIALVLAISMLSSLLTGCGKPKATVLSPEQTSVTTADGITVDVGDFVLDGEAELTVTKQPVDEHKDEGYKIEAYDFTLGDLHELGDFITIRIPYGTDFCEAGQDPARCVGAKYKNETTGEWEDVLFEVDAAAKEVVIYTDHLSFYGLFYVENEGKRSAYITDVLDGGIYMDPSTALDLSRRIADDDPSVGAALLDFGLGCFDTVTDYADQVDNAINIATAGDVPDWLSTEIPNTNQTMFSALGYLATCRTLLKVAYADTVGSGADKGTVLNLIRDVSGKVSSYWMDALSSAGGAALSVSMGGVLVLDKMLNAFAEEAKATKLEDMDFIYTHFNESFNGFGHKVMTPKDWRAKIIEIVEKHPDDPEVAVTALKAGFNKYANEFFDLTLEQMNEVASDTPNVTMKRVPALTPEEQETLVDNYIKHLESDVMPAVLTSVENYLINKTAQLQLQELNQIKDYYNSNISITLKENVSEGGSPAYQGYKFRFAPLSDTADVNNWTGKWNGDTISTSATLLGFMMAGLPHTVEFFAPDADMNTAQPEFVVPFVIAIPEINIEFGGAPTFDELVGNYTDGTVTITEVYVSDSARSELASKASDNELGCDLSELITSLEEQIGVPNDNPFSIGKTGENVGTLTLSDEPGPVTYNASSGILSFSLADDESGIDFSGDLKASHNSDKSGVIISGDLMTSLFFSPDDLRIVIRLDGTKPLQ